MFQGILSRGLTGLEYLSRQSAFSHFFGGSSRSYVKCFWIENNGIKGNPGANF